MKSVGTPTEDRVREAEAIMNNARDAAELGARHAHAAKEKAELEKREAETAFEDARMPGLTDDAINILNSRINLLKMACDESEAVIADFQEKAKQLEALNARMPKTRKEIEALISEQNDCRQKAASLRQKATYEYGTAERMRKDFPFEKEETARIQLKAMKEQIAEYDQKVAERKAKYEGDQKELEKAEAGRDEVLQTLHESGATTQSEKERELNALRSELLKERTNLTQLRKEKEELILRLGLNRTSLNTLNSLAQDLQDSVARRVWIAKLADTADSGYTNKEKLTLEEYVQTAYFDRIIDRANQRLHFLSDGQYAWLDKDAALAYIEAAKEEGVEFPVHLDMLVDETSKARTDRARSMKDSIESNTDGQIIIELVMRDSDTVTNIAYRNNDPAAMDYDISTFTGWGPDYADPKTFVDIYSPVSGYYMKAMGLENGLEGAADEDIKRAVGLAEYEELYRAADEIVDDMDARYEAFAKADAQLVESAFYIPTSTNTRSVRVTHVVPFTRYYSVCGMTEYKYKGLQLQEGLVTADEYNKAFEAWEKGE